MVPNGIQCPAISAGRNLPQTISFCRGLTSFANFRFFSALICFRYMKGVPRDTFLENQIGQADTFCLRGAGQRVRQDADQPGGEEIRLSEQHRAVCSRRQGWGPRSASRDNDTYVDGTSQSQTSRHKHGGRHETHILRSGLPRRRLFFAFDNIVISSIRTTQECGFCRFYSFHHETHLGGKHYAAVFSWPYGRRFFRRCHYVPHANGPETRW